MCQIERLFPSRPNSTFLYMFRCLLSSMTIFFIISAFWRIWLKYPSLVVFSYTLPLSRLYKYYINQYTFIQIMLYKWTTIDQLLDCQNQFAIFMCPMQKQTFQYYVGINKRIILTFTVLSDFHFFSIWTLYFIASLILYTQAAWKSAKTSNVYKY